MTGILPSFNRDRRSLRVHRPPDRRRPRLEHQSRHAGIEEGRRHLSGSEAQRAGAAVGAAGDQIIFGVGVFNAFYNGFNGLFLKPEDRVEGGAQIAVINPDGSGFREVTGGANNNAFPSMSPDGTRFVYRSFGPEGDGLKVMNVETKAVTTLTKGYDNFPLWSPRGDLIMFSRQADSPGPESLFEERGTCLRSL